MTHAEYLEAKRYIAWPQNTLVAGSLERIGPNEIRNLGYWVLKKIWEYESEQV